MWSYSKLVARSSQSVLVVAVLYEALTLNSKTTTTTTMKTYPVYFYQEGVGEGNYTQSIQLPKMLDKEAI